MANFQEKPYESSSRFVGLVAVSRRGFPSRSDCSLPSHKCDCVDRCYHSENSVVNSFCIRVHHQLKTKEIKDRFFQFQACRAMPRRLCAPSLQQVALERISQDINWFADRFAELDLGG